jgi:GDP-mannose pyrophosphatase NudK
MVSSLCCHRQCGSVDADERIEILEVPFEQAPAMIGTGEIRDAKTIALLYHAKAKRDGRL